MSDAAYVARLDENIERLTGWLARPELPAVCEYRDHLERSLRDLKRRRLAEAG